MTRYTYTLALLAAMWAAAALADDAPVKADALTNAVDPYDAADQKVKFLTAAGKDNELDEKEFLADQKTGKGLALPFDKWATVILFDKNKNGTLDWFEFHEYRQTMRKAVLAAFDKEKKGKLTGPERDAALKALRDGKVEIKPPAEAPRATFTPPTSAPAETATAGAEPASQPAGPPAGRGGRGRIPEEVFKKYDKDGDGALSPEEMTAFRRDMMWDNMPPTMKDFSLRNFDNADGRLTDEGWKAAEAYQREVQQMMQGWQSLIHDKDATEEQRRETMQKWAPVGMKMFAAAQQRSGGDMQAFGQKMAAGMARYSERFEKQALEANGGKPSEASRTAMLKLIDEDIRDRVKKASVSGSGKLEPDEGAKLFIEIMDEFLKE